MKKVLISFLILLIGSSCFAQLNTGYKGKKWKTSLVVGMSPNFSEKYDSDVRLGAFGSDLVKSIAFKYGISTEYQAWNNYALTFSVGFFNTKPTQGRISNSSGQTISYIKYLDVQAIPVKLGVKKGKGIKMPLSSMFFSYGLSMYFVNIKDVNGVGVKNTDYKESSIMPGIFLEGGRRLVFKHGIVVDLSVCFNITANLFSIKNTNYDVDLTKNAKRSVAFASLIDFKLAVGLFH